jgi:1-acyl-sn-glycerol-3-phosphate acyltransferase
MAGDGPVQYLRSLIYYVVLVGSVIVWAPFVLPPMALAPYRVSYALAMSWLRFQRFCLRHIVGLRYRIEGLENIPNGGAVVLSKHESMYETLMSPLFLPCQTWVLKRELLRIPFFGWGLAALKPIHIDRGSASQALRSVLRQGRARLAEGLLVIVYPEGTRVAPGESRPYQKGGAMLAARAGVPVVPMVHDAGRYWLRKRVLIRPGTVQFKIGPPIPADGKNANEINELAKGWIESNRLALDSLVSRNREGGDSSAADQAR